MSTEPNYPKMSNRDLAQTLREIGVDGLHDYARELGDARALVEAARRLNGGKRKGQVTE